MSEGIVAGGINLEEKWKIEFTGTTVQVFDKYGSLANLNVENWMSNIDKVEILTEQNKKKLSSALTRGIVGGVLLGGVGVVAGAVSAKSKQKILLIITYVDGSQDLVEGDSQFYQELMKLSIKNTNSSSIRKMKNMKYTEDEQAKRQKEHSEAGWMAVGCIFFIAGIIWLIVYLIPS